MRIAADLSFFAADRRGMGRVVRNVLKELLPSDADEWLLFVRKPAEVAPVNEWVRETAPAARVKTIPAGELPTCDVDVCWYPWNRLDVSPRSGRRVVSINDVNPFVFPHRSLWRRWDQYRAESRFRRAAAAADRIVTISEFSRQEICRYLHVDAAKIAVMPLGVDAGWFRQPDAADAPAAEPSAPCRGPRLLYVGSDDERKNLRSLLAAMTILHRRLDCPATLLCCGVGGKAAEKYAALLRDSGMTEHVRLQGFVPEGELRAAYAGSDLFVFPSLYEGFGLPILEAMAAGLPVVTSRAASLPEVGGEAAVYCDASDPQALAAAVADTWHDPGRRDELRRAGRQRASEFTWARAAQALRGILQESR